MILISAFAGISIVSMTGVYSIFFCNIYDDLSYIASRISGVTSNTTPLPAKENNGFKI